MAAKEIMNMAVKSGSTATENDSTKRTQCSLIRQWGICRRSDFNGLITSNGSRFCMRDLVIGSDVWLVLLKYLWTASYS